MNIELITGIVGIVGAVVAILLPILKRPHELRSMDAMTAKTFAEAAKIEAERAREACDELEAFKDAHKGDIALLKKEVEELKVKVAAIEQERDDLKDWAERLVHQLRSHDIEPVPFKRGKKIA